MVRNTSKSSPTVVEEVQRQFQTWRETRAKGERIPEGLWQAGASLFPRYSVYRISRALRLDNGDLRDRIRLCGKKRTSKSKETPRFVELPLGSTVGVAECRLKVKDSQGTRIDIKLNGTGVGPLLEAIKELLNVQL